MDAYHDDAYSPLPTLRQKSPRCDREERNVCFCGDQIANDAGNIRLRCRCLIHFKCLVDLLNNWSKDTTFIKEWGIECPYNDDCTLRQQFGHVYYITPSDANDLIAYEKLHGSSALTLEASLDPEVVKRFERLTQEKCTRLACGCYVHYDELVKHVKNILEIVRCGESVDGICCPLKGTGSCPGYDRMTMSLDDIRKLANYGDNLSRRHLLPTLSPRASSSQSLTAADIDDFEKHFDRHVRLGCGCLIECHALTDFLSAKMRLKSNSNLAVEKFICPHGGCCQFSWGFGRNQTDKYTLTAVDIDALMKCRSKHQIKGFREEALQLRVLLPSSISNTRSSEQSTNIDESNFIALFEATSKACPSCSFRQTHYHGHHCHHVKEGCYKCKMHFCYRCLSTRDENIRKRGSESKCLCGNWSSFCDTTDLMTNLQLTPYPHDKRCGCPICPECRPGRPCQGCDGNCAVCLDFINPGPAELTVVTDMQSIAQKRIYDCESTISAIRRRDLSTVTAYLDAGVHPTYRQVSSGMSFLHWACYCGGLEVLLLLVDRILSRLSVQTAHDWSAIHPLPDVIGADEYGRTPIFYACLQDHIAVIQALRLIGGDFPPLSAMGRACRDAAKVHQRDIFQSPADINCDDFLGRPLLHLAAINNLSLLTKYICTLGADVHLLDSGGLSPLHHAAQRGHVAVVRTLIKVGVDVDLLTQDGLSALHLASEVRNANCTESVRVLISEGRADVARRDSSGRSPMHIWCERRDTGMINFCWETAPPNLMSAVHYAASLGRVAMLNDLLDKGADINSQDSLGWTPLNYALTCGKTDAMTLLWSRGARLDMRVEGSQTILHRLCDDGNKKVLAIFLGNDDTSIDRHRLKNALVIQDSGGNTALHIASSRNDPDITRLLLQAMRRLGCADGLLLQNEWGWSAIQLWFERGDIDMITEFLVCGKGILNFDLQDKMGKTVLHCLASHGHVGLATVLLNEGARVDVASNDGWTALHYACFHDKVDMATFLLGRGAPLDIQDKSGRSPLHLAGSRGHQRTWKLLTAKGATRYLRNKSGLTPAQLAAEGGHFLDQERWFRYSIGWALLAVVIAWLMMTTDVLSALTRLLPTSSSFPQGLPSYSSFHSAKTSPLSSPAARRPSKSTKKAKKMSVR